MTHALRIPDDFGRILKYLDAFLRILTHILTYILPHKMWHHTPSEVLLATPAAAASDDASRVFV